MTLATLIAESITTKAIISAGEDSFEVAGPDELMSGYRGAYWFFFGMLTAALCVSVAELHKIGVVGSTNK